MKGKSGRNLTMLTAVLLIVLGFCLFPQAVYAGVLDGCKDAKVYDVAAYGADKTGAGVSDTAVQKALKEARTDLRRGNLDGKERAVIYFPAGTYRLNVSLRLYTNMCIAAEKETTIKCGGSDGIQMYSAENCTVEGGTWSSSGKGRLIYATRVKNLNIQNISLQNGNVGIVAYYSTVNLKNVNVSKCTNEGLCFSKNTKAAAQNCKITRNGNGYPAKGFLGHGIGVYGGAVLTITDSQISYNKACGVSLQKGKLNAANVVIRDNGYAGVGTSDKCSMTMKSCDIYHNGYKVSGNGNGISLVEGSTGTFTNCKIRSNKVSGLLLTEASRANVKGCTFKGNKAHNIYIENMTSKKAYCTIEKCTFYKCRYGSVEVRVKRKNAFSLRVKGKNKCYAKPNYIYKLNNRVYYQK